MIAPSSLLADARGVQHIHGENVQDTRRGAFKTTEGYVRVLDRGHPRANANGYVLEHIQVVMRVLGKALPTSAVVHHVNGNRADNRPENLVVCENHAYHFLLHRRQRARAACGNPAWLFCQYCGQYDDPVNLFVCKDGRVAQHRECRRQYETTPQYRQRRNLRLARQRNPA